MAKLTGKGNIVWLASFLCIAMTVASLSHPNPYGLNPQHGRTVYSADDFDAPIEEPFRGVDENAASVGDEWFTPNYTKATSVQELAP